MSGGVSSSIVVSGGYHYKRDVNTWSFRYSTIHPVTTTLTVPQKTVQHHHHLVHHRSPQVLLE